LSAAQATTVVDDDRLRITTWSFGTDGDTTGPHVHEYDYIVVPVTGGTFAVTAPDGGTRELTQRAGVPYLGKAGTEHDVANVSGAPAAFVEIELKR
jgi:quercetin dioxygenase-like cupin family protein